MEICHSCRQPVKAKEVQWREVLVCKQTHSSPTEYEHLPFHEECGHEQEYDAAYARNAAKYDGANGEKDWR